MRPWLHDTAAADNTTVRPRRMTAEHFLRRFPSPVDSVFMGPGARFIDKSASAAGSLTALCGFRAGDTGKIPLRHTERCASASILHVIMLLFYYSNIRIIIQIYETLPETAESPTAPCQESSGGIARRRHAARSDRHRRRSRRTASPHRRHRAARIFGSSHRHARIRKVPDIQGGAHTSYGWMYEHRRHKTACGFRTASSGGHANREISGNRKSFHPSD